MSVKRTSDARKTRSEKILTKHGITINPNLPCIEEEAEIRSAEEALKRAVTAFITAQIAIDICSGGDALESVEFFSSIMERFGLLDELTDDEKPYFDLEKYKSISQDDANEMQWRIEMCVPVFWALGLWKKMELPDEMTDTTPLIQLIGSCKDFAEIMSYVKPRDPSEILDEADFLFRMDWACVEARIKNDPSIAGELSPDVVMEQHKGINWLIRAFDAEYWDSVAPHT